MTLPSYFGAALCARAPASASTSAQRRPGWPAAVALAAAALLSACGSTPLPPWAAAKAPLPPKQRPLGGVPPRVTPAAVPGVVISTQPPAVDAPPGAVTTPVRLREVGELPYSGAVAARFPDPAARYATPGLAPDRQLFTTNAELSQWLSHLTTLPTANGTRATLLNIGSSQNGTPIEALVVTRAEDNSPDSLDATQRPTVVLIGQQHGDEPASSEALLVVAQQLVQGLLAPLTERQRHRRATRQPRWRRNRHPRHRQRH